MALLFSGCVAPTAKLDEGSLTPRQENITLYLGAWLPVVSVQGMQSLENRNDLVGLGANTVAFGVEIPYQADGSIKASDMEKYASTARRLIRYYKEAGLAILLSPSPVPHNLEGEPGPVPENIRTEVLKSYEQFVVKLAKIAEEENVEIFSPMNEPDYKVGTELSSTWGQKILPKVRAVYTGKVMWKGALGLAEKKSINFTGYDILGFTSFPYGGIEGYKERVGSIISAMNNWAEEDGVGMVFASEFGTYKPVQISKADEPKSIQYVFDKGEGRLDGFFVLDPPRGFGTPIKGSALEQVVKENFEKLR
ncbi:MAG: hypothetical protein HY515_04590 [Candidatus Aenigmarchaeota archaeon]|nr:hypothetical protein [Candidatus Aenigmarchaeota archaeon]